MSQYDSLTARSYAWFCLQIVGCTTVSLWTCWVEMGTWVTWLHFLKRQRITVNSLWNSKLVCSAVALLHSHVERPSPACCPYALYPSLPDTGCEVHKRAECRSQAWRWWDKIFSVENCASEIRNAVGLQGLLVILCDQARVRQKSTLRAAAHLKHRRIRERRQVAGLWQGQSAKNKNCKRL